MNEKRALCVYWMYFHGKIFEREITSFCCCCSFFLLLSPYHCFCYKTHEKCEIERCYCHCHRAINTTCTLEILPILSFPSFVFHVFFIVSWSFFSSLPNGIHKNRKKKSLALQTKWNFQVTHTHTHTLYWVPRKKFNHRSITSKKHQQNKQFLLTPFQCYLLIIDFA